MVAVSSPALRVLLAAVAAEWARKASLYPLDTMTTRLQASRISSSRTRATSTSTALPRFGDRALATLEAADQERGARITTGSTLGITRAQVAWRPKLGELRRRSGNTKSPEESAIITNDTCVDEAVQVAKPLPIVGDILAMAAMMRHEPLRLYNGLGASLIGAVPTSLVYMPTYELSKVVLKHLSATLPPNSLPISQLASIATGIACSCVRVPASVVKARMQLGYSPSLWHAVTTAVNGVGWRGLYAGWYATCVLDVSYAMIQFTVLEWLVTLFDASQGRAALSPQQDAIVGFLVGVFTAIATEPLDVIKTRLQTQRRAGSAAGGADFGYTGMFDGLAKMTRQEGVLALWRGLLPRLLLKSFGSCIWYYAYKTVGRLLAQGLPA